jgi:hypothetical protein
MIMEFLKAAGGRGPKEMVTVPDDQVTKVRIITPTKAGSERVLLMARAVAADGKKLCKFLSKEVYDLLPGEEVIDRKELKAD